MSLSEQEVRHVAMLARLALTDDEVTSLQGDLNSILGHIDSIQQLDLASVPPTAHAIPVFNVTRDDVVVPGLSREDGAHERPCRAGRRVPHPADHGWR